MLCSKLHFWLWFLVWTQVYPSKLMYLSEGPHTKPNRFIEFDSDSLVSFEPWVSASIPDRKIWFLIFCIYCLQIGQEAGSICGKWGIFRTITVVVYWQGPVFAGWPMISALHGGWISAAKPSCLWCLNCAWSYEVKLKCFVITALNFAALCQYHANCGRFLWCGFALGIQHFSLLKD